MVRFAVLVATILAIFGLAPLLKPAPYERTERSAGVMTSPGPDVLRLASANHNLAWADLTWLQVVQLIGSKERPTDVEFGRLYHLANIGTDLDPRYFTIYDASSVFLSAYGSLAGPSDALLEKGRRHLPQRWKLPFMMGWNDYFMRGNGEDAAAHWKDAALLPGAPFYLGSLSGRALRQATNDIEGSIAFLSSMLEHVGDPKQRDMIEYRINVLRSEPILREYDHACNQYIESQGKPPDSAQQLFMEGWVSHAPMDLVDSPIDLDLSGAECVARSELIKVREEEAVERIGQFRKTPAMGGRAPGTIEVESTP